MKKRKVDWKILIAVLLFGIVFVLLLLMYGRITNLTNQIAFIQDNTNVILSDVGGMQKSIKKTLQEESSIVESYSVEIVDMDFAKRTYDVDVSVIPKKYSDKTQVSIFFGTEEFSLQQDGYVYKGKVTLPLDKTYDGNVTFLIANGKKKMTEVLESYKGVRTNLEQVLSGSIEHTPVYKDGVLKLKTNCQFQLDGSDMYEFQTLELVTALDEQEIGSCDLFADINNPKDEGAKDHLFGIQQESTESEAVETVSLPIGKYSGNVLCKTDYELTDEEKEENHHIKVFIRAITDDGYRFEYTVFQANYLGSTNRLAKESYDTTTHSVVYDRRGNMLEFD